MLKVTIITVSFNSSSTIRDTILSVLSQDYPLIEYLIIDGGSTDGTLEILESFDKIKDFSFSWISEKDKGLYDAMNKGITHASGDIVGILNSDDFFVNERSVSSIMNNFNLKSDLDAVYGDVQYVNPSNLSKIVRKYTSARFNPTMFKFGFMPPHASFYCKRKLFDDYGKYRLDLKISADFELMLRFIYKEHIVTKYLHKINVTMRTGGISTRGIRSNILINKEIIKACKINGVYTNLIMLTLKYFIKVFELRF